MRTLMVTGLLFAVSCSNDDDPAIPNNPEIPVPDPQGTVMIDIRNAENGGNDFLGIGIDAANNFYSKDGSWSFISMGTMKGLGNIANIPDESVPGWAATVGARPGYGYIAGRLTFTAFEYVAFYVDKYITAAGTGGIIGAEVKYLYPFVNPTMTGITIKSGSTELAADAYSTTTLEVADISSYSVTVEPSSRFEASFIGQRQIEIISLQENEELQAVAGTLTIKSGNKFTKAIPIKQKGAAPYIYADETTIDIPGVASNGSIIVNSNVAWTANSNAAWCTITPSSGTGNGTIAFSAAANHSGTIRAATITLSATGAGSQSVIIKQEVWFAGGTGVMTDPYIIKTADQLNLMRNYATGCYFRLENNIDLTAYLNGSSNGWEPIPLNNTRFDGGGFTISGLWINRPNETYVGLFSRATDYTNNTISSLKLQLSSQGITGGQYTGGIIGHSGMWNSNSLVISNCSVTGNITGGQYTGGIIGGVVVYNNSSLVISNCSVTGNITGGENTGGVVGHISGNCVITISNCSVTGAVKGGANVGGIIGYVYYMTMTKCYSTGSVEGALYTGGLIGYIYGYSSTVEDSYSTSNVITKGFNYVCYAGGLVGRSTTNLTIRRSYYAGQLTVEYTTGGSASIGGLSGQSGSITNSYFDKDVAGTNFSIPPSTTTGALTTTQMKQQASFVGWDFSTVWQIVEGVSYPTLR